MKNIICDFCKNEKDKEQSFDFKKFEDLKLPAWGMVCIEYVTVDLCASCYRDCFTKECQNNLAEFRKQGEMR